MMKAPLILASILQHLKLDLLNREQVRPEPRISLRPKGTVWMRVSRL